MQDNKTQSLHGIVRAATMRRKSRTAGFTIVELLIVIVVIGILAAITIVAYNGIQARAKDSKRQTDLASIEKAINLYYVDNSGFPSCSGGTHQPGTAYSYNSATTCLSSTLVPKYMSSIPVDPVNAGSYQYRYAAGFKKTSNNSFVGDKSDNYILGAKIETSDAPQYAGWTGVPVLNASDLNYLNGSNN